MVDLTNLENLYLQRKSLTWRKPWETNRRRKKKTFGTFSKLQVGFQNQWSFLAPWIGGRYHIIPHLAVYTTYSPCQLGDYIVLYLPPIKGTMSSLLKWNATPPNRCHSLPHEKWTSLLEREQFKRRVSSSSKHQCSGKMLVFRRGIGIPSRATKKNIWQLKVVGVGKPQSSDRVTFRYMFDQKKWKKTKT